MTKILLFILVGGLRWAGLLLFTLAAFALLVGIIALPFVLIAGLLAAMWQAVFRPAPAPQPAMLHIAKETTMPAFLSVISYTLLVALMFGIGLGWIGGL